MLNGRGWKLRHKEGRWRAKNLLWVVGRTENRSLAYDVLSQGWIFLAISYGLPAWKTWSFIKALRSLRKRAAILECISVFEVCQSVISKIKFLMCGLWENYVGKSFLALKYITRNIFKTWTRQWRTSRILENDAQQSSVDYGWVLPMCLKCQAFIHRINGGSFCLKSFPLFLYI